MKEIRNLIGAASELELETGCRSVQPDRHYRRMWNDTTELGGVEKGIQALASLFLPGYLLY